MAHLFCFYENAFHPLKGFCKNLNGGFYMIIFVLYCNYPFHFLILLLFFVFLLLINKQNNLRCRLFLGNYIFYLINFAKTTRNKKGCLEVDYLNC